MTYHIHTYGCQMNVRDSETLAGWLVSLGYSPAETPEAADVILFNTCAIRAHAESRITGGVGRLANFKGIVGVCGCMSQRPGVAKSLMQRFPVVNFCLGPQTIHRLPEAITAAQNGKKSCFLLDDGPIVEGQPRCRAGAADPAKAFINVMAGCNNYCSYCIVPYTRGRERSRALRDIIDEAAQLAAQGVREVTLLGQNVNAWQNTLESGALDFADLLLAVAGVQGIECIKFMTSNPQHFTSRMIDVIAGEPKVAKQIHLPVQSGDNGVLQRMNRRYTREQYLQLVAQMRAVIPGLKLTTDMIAGFPGEDEAAHEASLSLLELVRFDGAFIFKFSARPGTAAHGMQGQVDGGIIRRRHGELLGCQEGVTDEVK